MIRVAVIGAGGRMGKKVIELVAGDAATTLVAAIDGPGAPSVGSEVAPEVTVTTDVAAALASADVYIDFSTPAATRTVAEAAASANVAAVIGTTGIDEAGNSALARLAENAPVLWAPNFSLGVNLLLGLARLAA
ncbi:MAG TPA: 4-hydroxy-tetrahydrodipicolinate reductase, partial [Kofleriaceae bacterium]|nr:4-hydroxy-tetrahydrodipicolinate reductase [Kofleriaceae bacterium]